MRPRLRGPIVLVPLVAPRALVVIAGLALAALLRPGPAPVAGAGSAPEAWLDRPLPEAFVPGASLTIGFMLWDPAGSGLPVGVFPEVRLLPGPDETPVEGVAAVTDWPGHYVASLSVPAGGAARLEIAVPGTACDAGGCRPADTVYEVAGVGPPPDARLTTLATAAIRPPAAAPVTGEPLALTVDLRPRADWDPATFPFPERLVVQAERSRGPAVADVEAAPVAGQPGTYEATVTLPEAGDFVLRVATSAGGLVGDVFATSVGTVNVVAVAPGDAPALEVPPGVDPLLVGGLGLVALLIVAVIAGGALAARREG